jgi:hapalindole biogenesis HpiC1 cyclase-like protein/PEP-CTERM motif-containing protein
MASTALATPITITNASFEAVLLADGGFTREDFSADPIPGWVVTPDGAADGGTYDPTTVQYPSGVPDGENVAFSSNFPGGSLSIATISQVLAATLAGNTLYTLNIDVGDRTDTNFGGYLIEFLAGSTVLASDNNSLLPSSGFLTSTVTFQTGASPSELGQSLQIRMRMLNANTGGPANQVNFDNVRLDGTLVDVTAVPEPVSLVLVGSGLAGLAARRFSRRRRS